MISLGRNRESKKYLRKKKPFLFLLRESLLSWINFIGPKNDPSKRGGKTKHLFGVKWAFALYLIMVVGDALRELLDPTTELKL